MTSDADSKRESTGIPTNDLRQRHGHLLSMQQAIHKKNKMLSVVARPVAGVSKIGQQCASSQITRNINRSHRFMVAQR